MRTTRRRLIVAAAVGVLLLSGGASADDHAWGPYQWARTSNPFTLLTGDNVTSQWDAYLNEAILDWNNTSVLILKKTSGATNPKNCRPTSGRIEVCNSKYGFNGWLGIAQIWITGGQHIAQATSKLNDSYFNTSTYNTPAWRRLVMCQEIAHDFGLDHQDEGFGPPNLGSCMDYTNDPDGGGAYGPSNEHPNADDYEMIETIYAHLDSFNSYDTGDSTGARVKMPPAMNQIDFEGPGQWGQLVRSSRNGRVQVFELDFGGGNKVITHVFWADPEGDRARGR